MLLSSSFCYVSLQSIFARQTLQVSFLQLHKLMTSSIWSCLCALHLLQYVTPGIALHFLIFALCTTNFLFILSWGMDVEKNCSSDIAFVIMWRNNHRWKFIKLFWLDSYHDLTIFVECLESYLLCRTEELLQWTLESRGWSSRVNVPPIIVFLYTIQDLFILHVRTFWSIIYSSSMKFPLSMTSTPDVLIQQ